MAEVLVKYITPVRSNDGTLYWAQACGRCCENGLWEGWLEFKSDDGSAIRSGRETEQSRRSDLVYWAEGLTTTYIEGALDRAQRIEAGPRISRPVVDASPEFEEPAPDRLVVRSASIEPSAVLNPFAVYREGEGVLRGQLSALSRDHLRSIALAYGFADDSPSSMIDSASSNELIEKIVRSVRREVAASPRVGDRDQLRG
jgi:hypothetical protein